MSAIAIVFGACGFRNGMGKAGLILGSLALAIALLCLFFFHQEALQEFTEAFKEGYNASF